MAKVLVIDDAAFMRGSLKFILENAGHNIVGTAEDGKRGVKMFKELKPDAVTLDILMKGLDGLSTLKEIMEEDPFAKVIMVTAMGQESKQEEARKLGASGYIRKPFKQEDVVKELERALGKAEGNSPLEKGE